MAKATKIIGGLVLASVLWLGGTAYISSNTKSHLNNYVKKSNSMYKANGMQMSVKHFEKGFFNSNAKIKIDFSEPLIREVLAETIKLPIEVNYEIENGPLFFKNGLGLGSSRVSSNVNLSEYVVDKEAFLKIFKDDIKLTSSSSIDFLNNASFTAITTKIVANVDGDEVHVSPLNIEGEMNLETFEGDMRMFIDFVQAKNNTEHIDIKEVVLDVDITKFYDNGFYLGDFVFSVGSLGMKDDFLPFELKEAKLVLEINVDENKDDTIDMKFKLKGDVGQSKLPMEYASLDIVELFYALHGVKLEGLLAFQEFTDSLQAKEQDVISRLHSPKTGELDMEVFAELEKMQTETMEGMMVLVAGLLKKDSTSFDAEIKMIDKEAKESKLKMNIGYVGDGALPTSAKELEAKFKKELFNLVSVDFDVTLEKDYISNLPAQFQQELAGQLQMGAMFGIVHENNSSFSFNANYKPKKLTLNGEDRSEMIQMLETSLSGEGMDLL